MRVTFIIIKADIGGIRGCARVGQGRRRAGNGAEKKARVGFDWRAVATSRLLQDFFIGALSTMAGTIAAAAVLSGLA